MALPLCRGALVLSEEGKDLLTDDAELIQLIGAIADVGQERVEVDLPFCRGD